MERNDLYNKGQHEFRKGRSCLSQLLQRQMSILTALKKGASMDIIYLDFAKVFDKMDHEVLLRKIQGLGIVGKLLKWIRGFLTNRKQLLVVDGRKSTYSEVMSGVPQETV